VGASRLLDHFDPAKFLIKITQQPTYQALKTGFLPSTRCRS
jgi:hypothetical protein